ncbi:unnamed protein product [Lepidochelys kempii]
MRPDSSDMQLFWSHAPHPIGYNGEEGWTTFKTHLQRKILVGMQGEPSLQSPVGIQAHSDQPGSLEQWQTRLDLRTSGFFLCSSGCRSSSGRWLQMSLHHFHSVHIFRVFLCKQEGVETFFVK